ncbi:MAG: adenylyl-sulfate kinase [Acidobacteria bacterium]|nr:adenylyl-sulfate kinase [Acidobacteriota bacterium]
MAADEGFVIWMTGLPSSGKSTIAHHLEEQFKARRLHVEILDGDEMREHLSPGLGSRSSPAFRILMSRPKDPRLNFRPTGSRR